MNHTPYVLLGIVLGGHLALSAAGKTVWDGVYVAAQAERAKLKEKIDNVLKGTGLSVHDLYGAGKRGRRGKSAAKYANPDDRSQTWTGRGRKPNWLIAKVKRGAKMSDFEI